MTRIWSRRILVAGLLALALAGHWAFHYRPRVRPLPAGGSDEIGRLWAAPDVEVALWVAYPHQNLGALERHVGDLDRLLADIATVLDSSSLRVPRFGPFRFPPARELVALEAQSQPRWRGAARIYPTIALAARAAGRLTGNAWLGGGVVRDGDQRLQIDWQGNLWSLGEPTSATSEPEGEEWGSRDAIARLRLTHALGRWPSGEYELKADDTGLWLGERGFTPEQLDVSAAWPRAENLSLALREGEDSGVRALLFFDRDGGFDVPSVASVARGIERRRLPGEKLLLRLGVEVVEQEHDGWVVAAYSDDDLLAALPVLEDLAMSSRPGTSIRLMAGPVGRLSGGIGHTLEQIPILGEREAAYWLAVERLLQPLGEEGLIEISLAEPVFLHLQADPAY